MKRLLTIALSFTATAALGFAQSTPVSLDNSFQTGYATNLNNADAVVNINNTGATGAVTSLTGFRTGVGIKTDILIVGGNGNICVNVYAMASDEQEVSCCSCPVTPDGLVSLSVNNDLLNNPLTPATVTSVVIKLYATEPIGNSCSGSAALSGVPPAPGLSAWGTTTHLITGLTTGATENPFTPSTPSAGELTKLQSFCAFAIANGSGYGICNSCRPGGLGANKH